MLDANVQMFSTRYAIQKSCEGLYPRYQAVRRGGQGNWFVARTEDGCVVGLSTVLINEEGKSRIDGFAHPRHLTCMGGLIDNAMRWGAAQGASIHQALISETDATKLTQFESAGFQIVAKADPFMLNDRRLPAVRLERPSGV